VRILAHARLTKGDPVFLRVILLTGAAAIVALALLGVAGCGGDDSGDGAGMDTDTAFLAAMTAHHEAAIEMADLAREQADHAEVRQLADRIIATQGDEIEAMDGMHERISGMSMGEGGHGTMGMSEHEMGMDMDMASLRSAEPFDRAFIDAMVAHHQGAIRMARVELEEGSDPEVKDLAEAIIAAQSREIAQMNAWHQRWYGSASSAGGVPDEDDAMHGAEMGH
jgi:uncharacterized protein (DUF305 family)